MMKDLREYEEKEKMDLLTLEVGMEEYWMNTILFYILWWQQLLEF